MSGTEVCPKCGNPVDFGRFVELERRLKPELRKARSFLGVVAALELLCTLPDVRARAPAIVIGVHLFACAYYGACFLAAFRRPLGAAIGGLALTIFAEANVIGMGRMELVFKSLISNAIIVILLVAAIRSGYRVRVLRGQWSRRDRTIGIGVLAGSAIGGLLWGVVAARLS